MILDEGLNMGVEEEGGLQDDSQVSAWNISMGESILYQETLQR